MVYLGVWNRSWAIPSQARHWYQQAISTGHPDVAPGQWSPRVMEQELGNPEPGPALVPAGHQHRPPR